MGAMAYQITSLTIIYSTVYSGADQRNPQSSASLAFVRGINRWPVNAPLKWPVTRKMFPFDDVIMIAYSYFWYLAVMLWTWMEFTKTNSQISLAKQYSHVITSTMASQIASISIVCSTVCSGADQRKHQSSASLAFVRRIHRWPVDSSHKDPVTRKIIPFDDVIMI